MAQTSTLHTTAATPHAWACAAAAGLRRPGTAALLQVALTYAAWTVLAHMGTQLSWLWWGGMSGVLLWWLLRVWQPERAWHHRRAWHGALGLLSVLGLCLMQSPLPSWVRWLGLLALALGMAGTGNALQTLSVSPSPSSAMGAWAQWRIHAAAIALVALMAADFALWSERWAVLLLVLGAATLVLFGRASPNPSPQPVAPRTVDPNMAVMMGSLTLMTQWCVAQGLSAPLAMALHLGLMALADVLPPLARRPLGVHVPAASGHVLSVLSAVAVLLSTELIPMLLAMGLLAMGSAWTQRPPSNVPSSASLWVGAGLGSLGLVFIAQSAPLLGPAAIGWGLLSVTTTWALWAWCTSNRSFT